MEIVMLFPVRGDFGVDHAGPLVPDSPWGSRRARRENRRPPRYPTAVPSGSWCPGRARGDSYLRASRKCARGSCAWPGRCTLCHGPSIVIGVLVLVDIDHRVGAEVDRVGAGGVAAVVLLGIEDLGRQGLPAAGRAAVEESRPAGADAAVFLLEVRNQLIGDGVAVRARDWPNSRRRNRRKKDWRAGSR